MEFNKQSTSVKSSASEAIIDQGLRAYMLKVYNYMASEAEDLTDVDCLLKSIPLIYEFLLTFQ